MDGGREETEGVGCGAVVGGGVHCTTGSSVCAWEEIVVVWWLDWLDAFEPRGSSVC